MTTLPTILFKELYFVGWGFKSINIIRMVEGIAPDTFNFMVIVEVNSDYIVEVSNLGSTVNNIIMGRFHGSIYFVTIVD